MAIELSEGLRLAPGLQPPGGTTFDSDTMIWDVGTLSETEARPTLDVPVVVAQSPSLAELPLERRCLTAEVVEALPAYETDPRWRLNDVFTLCLGQPPAVISEGEIILWWLHDCVNVASMPCGEEDELKLFATAVNDNERDYYLEPESVLVHIPDQVGREYDQNTHSVTDGSTVSWQTGRKESGSYNRPGLRVFYSRTGLNSTIDAWRNIVRTVSVSGLDGPVPPGRVKVRHDSPTASTFYDPAPSDYRHERAPFNLTSATAVHNDYFLEFEELGTYVVNFRALATRTDGTEYEADGDYIFHVGPMAELEVRDGEQHPALPWGQQAYTIHALNDGPDTAPAVEVTLSGVPQGAKPTLNDGEYRELACQDGLCTAIWDLGEMPLSDTRVARGVPEFPTLTLIVPDGSRAPDISASIANTRDYQVCIDSNAEDVAAPSESACTGTAGNTWHTTEYYDYIDDNDTAVIAARAGTGAGDPGTPAVTAQAYPAPPTAVLRWDPVERLNRWPVSHYEVWRSDASCRLPGMYDRLDRVHDAVFVDNLPPDGFDELKCYYVRAVNDLGVPGHWSAPVEVSGVQPAEPQVSVRGSSPAATEGRDVTFTISAFPRPVVGESLTVGYTVTQQGDFVAAADLGQQSVTIYSDGEATVTVRTTNDAVNEANGAVTVTLNNRAGYKLSSARSASVRVLDDDRPRASFASGASSHLEDEAGPHDVIVLLEPAPTTDLTLRYAVSGTATRGRDYSMADYGAVTVPAGATFVAIPVTITEDANSEPAETVELTLRAGSNYHVGDATHILTIGGNDQPEIAFSAASASVGESAGTYRAVIAVEPAPHEDLTINYRIGGSAASPGDYTVSNSGTVTARRGADRVEIPISIKDDRDNEGDESVILTLSSGRLYSVGSQNSFWLTILDDDNTSATPVLTVCYYRDESRCDSSDYNREVHEAGQLVPSMAIHGGPLADGVKVKIQYVGGTAQPEDFTINGERPVKGKVYDAFEAYGEYRLRTKWTYDRKPEGAETAIFRLLNAPGYTIEGPTDFTVTIRDRN